MDFAKTTLLSDIKRIQLRTRRIVDSDLMGQYRSAFRGSGMVYSELREYQPGDEIKHIHWRASARSGKVFVKSYDEERLLNILLMVDISRSTAYGSPRQRHERACEFAALIALLAQNNGDALGLTLFSSAVDDYLPARHSRTQIQRVLLKLLETNPNGAASNLTSALDHARQHFKRRGIVFVISDFICPPFTDALRRLSYRHDVICVQLTDEATNELPDVGLVQLEDAESGRLCLVDSSSPRLRRSLADKSAAALRELQRSAQISGCDLISIRDNTVTPLVGLMRRRAQRIGHSAGSAAGGGQ